MPQGRIASRPYAPRMTLAQLAENAAREREGREPIRNEPTFRRPMRLSTRVAQGVQNLLTLAFGDQGQDPSDLMSPILAPIKAGAKVAGRAIRAYHGSPHDFEKFSLGKIGTGEGAQAYGHGLYFAENPTVAEMYRAVSEPAYRNAGTRLIVKEAMAEAEKRGLSGEEARRWARKDIHRRAMERPDYSRGQYFDASNNIDDILDTPVGRTYEVDIKADPDEFLDWDKPLSEQSEKVRKALGPMADSPTDIRASIAMWQDRIDRSTSERAIQSAAREMDKLKAQLARTEQATGAEFYRGLADNRGGMTQRQREWGGSVTATEELRKAGIKGIRYKDALSRGSEGGTANYVVFDDKIIDIMKKYGVALPVAAILFQLQEARSKREQAR